MITVTVLSLVALLLLGYIGLLVTEPELREAEVAPPSRHDNPVTPRSRLNWARPDWAQQSMLAEHFTWPKPVVVVLPEVMGQPRELVAA